MNQETLYGGASVLLVALMNYVTYVLSRRTGKQDTKAVKVEPATEPATEFSKNYVDDLILQLQSRIEECGKTAERAVEEANAAKEQVGLLNLFTTDLQKQITSLQEQLVNKTQEIIRVEGERDTAIAERNTLQQIPDDQKQGHKAIESLVGVLVNAIEKRWPLPSVLDRSTVDSVGKLMATEVLTV